MGFCRHSFLRITKPDGNYIKLIHVKIKSKYSAFSKPWAPNPFCTEAHGTVGLGFNRRKEFALPALLY